MFDEQRDRALGAGGGELLEIIEALAEHEPVRDVYLWAVRQIEDPSLPVRLFAVQVLERLAFNRPKFSAEAAEAIRPRLTAEDDPEVLESLVSAYAEFRHPHEVGELRQLMAHPDDLVRAQVAWRLDAIEPLLVLAYDAVGEVRGNALANLFRRTEPGTTAVQQAYADHRDDDNEDARIESLAGLARDGDEDALAVLHAIAAVQQGFTAQSRIDEIDFRRSLHFGH
ncbi:HEAT repeat domain-containing protein [Paractinoplanes lichenicola]|uniref:HEAT repeat domain-containing protein n=1 Tax=Paractinoplanes lichenicola TaxID=2802976 RepID=A0ABS1VW80_9ACTN|nr:HEAT repeat domain-containing protein [Actinoplanes lichenicola]MBL7258743.1 HEAT repeat domain-containing protein [Actinoplanes lichenicola]